MRIRGLIIITIACLWSCVPKQNLKISLSEEKLSEILFDLRTAEQVVLKYPEEIRDSVRLVFQKDIERIHSVPYNEIEINMIEVQKDAELMGRLNKNLKERIEKYKEELDLKAKSN